MTLLTLCQQAIREVSSHEVPATLIGNENPTAKQVLALAQREGRILSRRTTWQRLLTEHTFNTTASTATYSLPSDFRRFVSGTWWDRANYWQLYGPASPQIWQNLKSGIVTEGVRKWFRIQGDNIVLHPTPTVTNETIVFEYLSYSWCESSSGDAQTAWAADDDVGRLDEEVMSMGVKWRFLKEKGLPYDEDWNEYEIEVQRLIANDGDAPTLRTDREPGLRPGIDFNGVVNIPDGGFG